MMDDMVQRCKPDLTDTEIGMSVFGGSLFVLAVVDMENCDLILAEGFVKLIQDEIRICCEIISCVVDVAGVEADAQRLIPDGDFVSPSLWIRSSQTSNCSSMISSWLAQIDYNNLSGIESVVSDADVSISYVAGGIIVNGEVDSLSLFNLSGAKVLETSANTIATSSLSSGIYLAQINSGKKSVAKKIMINR